MQRCLYRGLARSFHDPSTSVPTVQLTKAGMYYCGTAPSGSNTGSSDRLLPLPRSTSCHSPSLLGDWLQAQPAILIHGKNGFTPTSFSFLPLLLILHYYLAPLPSYYWLVLSVLVGYCWYSGKPWFTMSNT